MIYVLTFNDPKTQKSMAVEAENGKEAVMKAVEGLHGPGAKWCPERWFSEGYVTWPSETPGWVHHREYTIKSDPAFTPIELYA